MHIEEKKERKVTMLGVILGASTPGGTSRHASLLSFLPDGQAALTLTAACQHQFVLLYNVNVVPGGAPWG